MTVAEMTQKEILIEAQENYLRGDDVVRAVARAVGPFEAGNGEQCDAYYRALVALDRTFPENEEKKGKKRVEKASAKEVKIAFCRAIERESGNGT
jgi:hypothetical protein